MEEKSKAVMRDRPHPKPHGCRFPSLKEVECALEVYTGLTLNLL